MLFPKNADFQIRTISVEFLKKKQIWHQWNIWTEIIYLKSDLSGMQKNVRNVKSIFSYLHNVERKKDGLFVICTKQVLLFLVLYLLVGNMKQL